MIMPKETAIKVTTVLAMIMLLAISGYVLIKGWLNGSFESVETLREYVAGYGVWAPIILFLIQVLQGILPIIPTFLGYVTGAVLFGSAGGFIVNYSGISAGAIIAFLLAKKFGPPLVNKMISLEKHDAFMKRVNRSRSYPIFLFVTILLPLAPDVVLYYFSGLINMPTKRYVWIIILGKPWCILFYSIFFAYFI